MQQQLRRNAMIFMGANIANAAVPFLLLPVLTRVMSPDDYGIIAIFAVLLGVFGAFGGLSLHGAIAVRYFRMSADELASFVTTCVAIVACSSAMVLAVVLLLSSPLEDLTGLSVGWQTAAVIAAMAAAISQIRLSLWQVKGQALRYGAFQFSQTLINALLSLFLVLVIGKTWDGRLIGQCLALISFGILALLLLRGAGFLVAPTQFRSHARDALRFGLPLIPHVLGGLIIVALDRIIIVGVMGLASAGLYMVGAQIGQILGLLTDSFNKAYSPWLMARLAKPDEQVRRKIVRGTYLYFMVVISIAILMGLFAPFIVGALAGDSFQDAQHVVPYIVLGYAFSGCYLMVANYIFLESRTAFLAYVTFASGAFHAAMTWFLISTNGIEGAAQAFAISQFCTFVATWILAQRVHPMPWRRALRPSE